MTSHRPFDQQEDLATFVGNEVARVHLEHQAAEEARIASEPLPEPSTDIPFDHWTQSPRELARLLRWIALRDIEISDIPAFLEAPRTWEREYEHMLAAEKRGPRTLG